MSLSETIRWRERRAGNHYRPHCTKNLNRDYKSRIVKFCDSANIRSLQPRVSKCVLFGSGVGSPAVAVEESTMAEQATNETGGRRTDKSLAPKRRHALPPPPETLPYGSPPYAYGTHKTNTHRTENRKKSKDEQSGSNIR
jgi:hypothetical protein